MWGCYWWANSSSTIEENQQRITKIEKSIGSRVSRVTITIWRHESNTKTPTNSVVKELKVIYLGKRRRGLREEIILFVLVLLYYCVWDFQLFLKIGKYKFFSPKADIQTERAYWKQPTIFQNKRKILLGETGKKKFLWHYKKVEQKC